MDKKLALRLKMQRQCQQMQLSIEDEIAQRTQRHQDRIARTIAAAPAPNAPLALLAHGDSWFDYPLSGNCVSLNHTYIIVQLATMGTPNPLILNLSQWGDAATAELSWPKQQRMINVLQNLANWLTGNKPDAILFSGGGNDIAGDQ